MIAHYNKLVITEEEVYSLNEHFETRLDDDHVLITTRHGGWITLSNEEYDLFKKNPCEDETLFKELERTGIILTERNMKNILRDLYRQHSTLFLYPVYNVISLTDRCNLDCIYCYSNSGKGEDLDLDTAKSILDFIFNTPGRQLIVLEGGEPLLKFDLIQYLYEESKKRSEDNKTPLSFSFGTNLTLMDEDIAREIKKMGITPCTSLDGPKELHDQQRPYIGGRGSYEDVVYWIKTLREDFDIVVPSLSTMTKYSLEYDPKDIVDTYAGLGLETVFFKPFHLSGRGFANMEDLSMDPIDFFDFWRGGVERCIELWKKGIPIREKHASEFVEHFLYPDRHCMCNRRPCGAGIETLAYSCDGTICGCDDARNNDFLDIGHVKSDNYRTIRSKILPLAALSSDLIPVCSTCEYMAFCSICLSSVYRMHNDLYPKVPRDFECKWKKEAFKYLFQKLSGEDSQILRSWGQCGQRRGI